MQVQMSQQEQVLNLLSSNHSYVNRLQPVEQMDDQSILDELALVTITMLALRNSGATQRQLSEGREFARKVALAKRTLSEKVLARLARFPDADIQSLTAERSDLTERSRVSIVLNHLNSSLISPQLITAGAETVLASEDTPTWVRRVSFNCYQGWQARGRDEKWIVRALLNSEPHLPLEVRAVLTGRNDWQDPAYGWLMADGHEHPHHLPVLRERYPELADVPTPLLLDVVSTQPAVGEAWSQPVPWEFYEQVDDLMETFDQ